MIQSQYRSRSRLNEHEIMALNFAKALSQYRSRSRLNEHGEVGGQLDEQFWSQYRSRSRLNELFLV